MTNELISVEDVGAETVAQAIGIDVEDVAAALSGGYSIFDGEYDIPTLIDKFTESLESLDAASSRRYVRIVNHLHAVLTDGLIETLANGASVQWISLEALQRSRSIVSEFASTARARARSAEPVDALKAGSLIIEWLWNSFEETLENISLVVDTDSLIVCDQCSKFVGEVVDAAMDDISTVTWSGEIWCESCAVKHPGAYVADMAGRLDGSGINALMSGFVRAVDLTDIGTDVTSTVKEYVSKEYRGEERWRRLIAERPSQINTRTTFTTGHLSEALERGGWAVDEIQIAYGFRFDLDISGYVPVFLAINA